MSELRRTDVNDIIQVGHSPFGEHTSLSTQNSRRGGQDPHSPLQCKAADVWRTETRARRRCFLGSAFGTGQCRDQKCKDEALSPGSGWAGCCARLQTPLLVSAATLASESSQAKQNRWKLKSAFWIPCEILTVVPIRV